MWVAFIGSSVGINEFLLRSTVADAPKMTGILSQGGHAAANRQ